MLKLSAPAGRQTSVCADPFPKESLTVVEEFENTEVPTLKAGPFVSGVMKNQTSGTPARLRKFWFPILAFTLLAIPTMGVVEALRSDRPYAIRVSRLLIVFLAFTSLAIVALVTGYFTTRQMLSDITVAHQRLEMVMS